MIKTLLFRLIEKCELAYSPVRAIVCDMGNKKLLSQLGVNMRSRQFYFENPFQENRKVYIFPDMCHCVKNMRNHTLDYGMTIKLGDQSDVTLTKGHFTQLISCDGTDFKLCHKLTNNHVEMKSVERQRVRPAFQLFSNSVAQAFRQVFGNQAEGQAQVVETIDSWIDVKNSSNKFDSQKSNRCGLGEILK